MVITIPVAITVIRGRTAFDGVEDTALDVDAGRFQLLQRAFNFFRVVLAEARDHQRGAHLFADNRRVSHRQCRRGVDDHQIKMLAHRFQELVKALGHQQFGRVRRCDAARNVTQPFKLGAADQLLQRNVTHQVVAEAALTLAPE